MMAWLMGARLGRAVSALGAAVLVVLAAFAAGRRDGGRAARERAREADAHRARELEEEADEVLRRLDGDHRDVDERLRELGGFRRD